MLNKAEAMMLVNLLQKSHKKVVIHDGYISVKDEVTKDTVEIDVQYIDFHRLATDQWHAISQNDYPDKSLSKGVLVTLKNGTVIEAKWFGPEKKFKIVCQHGIAEICKNNPVIAWMDKPDAYTEL